MKIKRLTAVLSIFCVLTLAACGSNKDQFVTGQYYYPSKEAEEEEAVAETTGETETEAPAEQNDTLSSELFLITNNDMQAECLILEQLASGKQYMYYYSLATRFLDKYGNRASVSCFEPGRIICVGKKDEKGRLLEAQISDQVWEYPDVTRYSIDEDRGVFQIADTNYSYGEDVFVNSDGNMLEVSDLTDLDTLRVVGIGKNILSVSVTTGHGELQLQNTELFEGSFIQIGSRIFSEITKDMSMEIPEGTYMVAVANKGYGGSTEIEVKRGQETVLDLDTLKGEGPKYGRILFAVDVVGAILQIDGKVVDYSEPVSLQYGVHALSVSADSYETYSKKLFVNSEEATILIGLTDEVVETASSGTGDSESAEDSESTDTSAYGAGSAGSLAGSLAGSHSGSASSGSSSGSSAGTANSSMGEAELDAIVDGILEEEEDKNTSDYLSTLAEILSALKDKDE